MLSDKPPEQIATTANRSGGFFINSLKTIQRILLFGKSHLNAHLFADAAFILKHNTRIWFVIMGKLDE
jgi:hypothetical protein